MNFISDKSGIKVRKPKVIFVGSSDYLGRHFLDETKEYAKTLGIDIGPDVWISDASQPGDKEGKHISPLLAMINSYNPDFAYLSLTSKEASLLLQEVKKADLKTKWICSMRTFDENLLPFDGVIGVQPISPFGEDIPGMAAVKEAHQRWHPYRCPHTLLCGRMGHGTQVIAEALGRALPEKGLSREDESLGWKGLRILSQGVLSRLSHYRTKTIAAVCRGSLSRMEILVRAWDKLLQDSLGSSSPLGQAGNVNLFWRS